MFFSKHYCIFFSGSLENIIWTRVNWISVDFKDSARCNSTLNCFITFWQPIFVFLKLKCLIICPWILPINYLLRCPIFDEQYSFLNFEPNFMNHKWMLSCCRYAVMLPIFYFSSFLFDFTKFSIWAFLNFDFFYWHFCCHFKSTLF